MACFYAIFDISSANVGQYGLPAAMADQGKE
jgi:hypothetical protein